MQKELITKMEDDKKAGDKKISRQKKIYKVINSELAAQKEAERNFIIQQEIEKM